MRMIRDSYDEDGNQIGPVIQGPGGRELYLWHGKWHLASASGEREVDSVEESNTLAKKWGRG